MSSEQTGTPAEMARQMTGRMARVPFYPDGLPATTVELLAGLDARVRIPDFNVEDLADESMRLYLAKERGKRELVDQLISNQREQERKGRGRHR